MSPKSQIWFLIEELTGFGGPLCHMSRLLHCCRTSKHLVIFYVSNISLVSLKPTESKSPIVNSILFFVVFIMKQKLQFEPENDDELASLSKWWNIVRI